MSLVSCRFNHARFTRPRAVLDSFKISIAKLLSETLPVTLENAFASVDYGKKGEDFTVALPRLRPGMVGEIAAKWKRQQRKCSFMNVRRMG